MVYHGLVLRYYCRDMDLNSLSINANEEVISLTEEKRAELVQTEDEILRSLESDLQDYSNVIFSMGFFNVIRASNMNSGDLGEKDGTTFLFNMDLGDDNLIFHVFKEGDLNVDFRKMIPSFERIHSEFSELEKVTLVRGINFIQQQSILQFHTNRILQYLEMDYIQDRWQKNEALDLDSELSDLVIEIDGLVLDSKPDFLKFATVRIPWSVDLNNNRLLLNIDGFSGKVESLITFDEDVIMRLWAYAIPLPLIPKIINDLLNRYREIYNTMSVHLIDEWIKDLHHSFIRQLVTRLSGIDIRASLKLAEFIETMTGIIDDLSEKYQVGFSGLGYKIEDLDYNIFASEKYPEFKDSFKEVFSHIEFIDDVIEIFRKAHESLIFKGLDPSILKDKNISTKVLDRFFREFDGIKENIVPALIRSIQKEILRRSMDFIRSRINDIVLSKEVGVVRDIGEKILNIFTDKFLTDEVSIQLYSGSSSDTDRLLLNLQGYKQRLLQSLKEFIANYKLDVNDFIRFANELLDDKEKDLIVPHLNRFLALKRDVGFLKEYIFKPEIFNEFIEWRGDLFYDPNSFSKQFSEIIMQRVEDLPIEWPVIIPNWFTAFSNVLQVGFTQEHFGRPEILSKFFDFVEVVAERQCQFDNIFAVISSYIASIDDSNADEKNALLEFLKKLEYSKDVQEKFTKYFEKKIQETIESIDLLEILGFSLSSEGFLDGVIADCINERLRVFPDSIIVPAEIRLVSEKNRILEFRLNFQVKQDHLEVDISTNWFKIGEV
ncbi:MAG: hypothetical protein ACTSWN_05030 [Promethearchaeota archaeon]